MHRSAAADLQPVARLDFLPTCACRRFQRLGSDMAPAVTAVEDDHSVGRGSPAAAIAARDRADRSGAIFAAQDPEYTSRHEPGTLIKKYAERRLYDASKVAHHPDDIAPDREGEKIPSSRTRRPRTITRHILLQVIAEQEQSGAPFLKHQGARGDHPLYGNRCRASSRVPREERRAF